MIAIPYLHAGATLVMTGLIWFVQVVHYPLMNRVGGSRFTAYESEHVRRTGWVVTLPMILELATALWLVWERPEPWSPTAVWAGLGLVMVIWASTVLLQMPAHARLRRSFDERTHRSLVAGNWIRTVAWTARAVLVLGLLARLHP